MVVTASRNIVTPHGLCIALRGARGRAVRGARACKESNVNKVLVVFQGRCKGYWCTPGDLEFPDGLDQLPYISARIEFDPFKNALELPCARASYEFHFGENLKAFRLARKLSQADLGRRMGKFGPALAQSTICYREGSPHSPNGRFVESAARALQVPVFVFFMNFSEGRTFKPVQDFICSLSSAVCK